MANATCEDERRCGWFGPTTNLRVRSSRQGLNYACPKCGSVVHVVARDWLGEAARRAASEYRIVSESAEIARTPEDLE